MFQYRADTGEATGASSIAGPVSEAQMDEDAKLVTAVLNLLNSDEGELVEHQLSNEQVLLRNTEEPDLTWHQHREAR